VRRGAWIAVGALVVAALAAVIALVLLRPREITPSDLSRLLTEVDAAVSGGYLSTARERLAGISRLPTSESDALRILKRAYAVSDGLGDYALLADLGSRAAAAVRGSASVRSIAAYGLVRAGRLADAEKMLARGGAPADFAARLSGEIILRRGGEWKGSDSLTRDLLSLDESSSQDAFQSAALRTGDDRLSLDAALLAMKAGDPRAAWAIATTRLGDARFDEPAGLMLYDEGDASGALARLRSAAGRHTAQAESLLVIADVLRASGDPSGAEAAIARALPLAPRISWTPYADLAYFAAARSEGAEAMRRIGDGLAFFPTARGLLMARARLAAASGQDAEALAALEKLISAAPNDGAAGLLLVHLQSRGLTPDGYRARLWKLFDRVPTDGDIFLTLALTLVASHDWDGVAIALDRYIGASGDSDADTLLIAALVAWQRGRPAEATALLERADRAGPDGRAQFDLALLALLRNDPQEALRRLDASRGQMEANAELSPRRASRIEMFAGFAHALDGNGEAARTALARAIMDDGENLRAGLFLRKLAAGGQ
jgi:tetratricopeptide (TPR) repeat protein